ncbi:LPS export ABC transporter periplasmic protein LptC [Hymenobacter sp. DG25A]|uniref:LPS export ABC transporter periplasmic protein LptC n=1 Tax=Hymenobacter sp. DG25A TaxID=1385663 RepID=UPI0008FF980B|nr:LPS export ABC transporter periplasmic protein LptC [Hymenobacter sp. DG25A]
MSSHGRHWLWSGLLLAALGTACESKSTVSVKPVVYKGPLLESQHVTILFSDSAKLQIKLTAPVQQQFENGDQVFPKGMQVVFFGKDKQVVNTLSGNYGKFDRNSNLYIVRGNVRVNNAEKHQKLSTEELFYNKQKGTIYTDKFVRVETLTEILTGTGLTANQEFSRYKILKPAGIFTVEPPAAE